jgi:uncharacterized protein YceK
MCVMTSIVICGDAARLEAAGEGGPGATHKPGSVEADMEYEWVTPNEHLNIPFSRSWDHLLLLSAEYDLCLTGGMGSGVAPTSRLD